MERVASAVVIAATLTVAAACAGGGPTTTTNTPATTPATQSGQPAPTPVRAPVWPAPPNPLQLAVRAGLKPEVREQLAYHVHAHLDVFVNGSAVIVPAGLGINIRDPNVQHAPDARGGNDYGGITGCATPCISPLHTHDPSGWLHTESATPSPNRLGQLFTEWNVRLDRSCVADYCAPKTPVRVFVDGSPYNGDPRSIELSDLREIAIVIGTPPARIPSSVPAAGP